MNAFVIANFFILSDMIVHITGNTQAPSNIELIYIQPHQAALPYHLAYLTQLEPQISQNTSSPVTAKIATNVQLIYTLPFPMFSIWL